MEQVTGQSFRHRSGRDPALPKDGACRVQTLAHLALQLAPADAQLILNLHKALALDIERVQGQVAAPFGRTRRRVALLGPQRVDRFSQHAPQPLRAGDAARRDPVEQLRHQGMAL